MSTSDKDEDEVVCNACGFEASFVPEGMLPCDRCKAVHYCSLHCLQWDWKSGGHAKTCVDIRPQQTLPAEVEDEEDVPALKEEPKPIVEQAKASKSTSSSSSLQSRRKKQLEQLQAASMASASSTKSSSNGLGSFLETQNQQAAASGRKQAPQPKKAAPVVHHQDEYYEEEVIEEEVISMEEEESISIDINDDESQAMTLKSIVEEGSEVSGEPEMEGSWRSRDPFEAVSASNLAHHPQQQGSKNNVSTGSLLANVIQEEEEEEEGSYQDESNYHSRQQQEDDTGSDDSSQMPPGYEGFQGGTAVAARSTNNAVNSDQSTDKVEESDSSALLSAYGKKTESECYSSQIESSADDSRESDEFDEDDDGMQYNDEYGYPSSSDEGDFMDDGSMDGEAASVTCRTTDTELLAAQPDSIHQSKTIAEAFGGKRLLQQDDSIISSDEDEDDDSNAMLFQRPAALSSKPPPLKLPRGDDTKGLNAGSAHGDSCSWGEATLAGDSQEEESGGTSLTSGVGAAAAAAAITTAVSTTATQGTKSESPALSSSMGAAAIPPKSTERADSGGTAATTTTTATTASLKDFRNAYSTNSPPGRKNQSLKDFRQIYQSKSSPSKQRGEVAAVGLPPVPMEGERGEQKDTFGDPTKGTSYPVDVEKAQGNGALTGSPESVTRNLALTKSINKALRDYEKMYGPEAATVAIMKLTGSYKGDDQQGDLSENLASTLDKGAPEQPDHVALIAEHSDQDNPAGDEPVVVATALTPNENERISDDSTDRDRSTLAMVGGGVVATGAGIATALVLNNESGANENTATPGANGQNSVGAVANSTSARQPRYLSYRSSLSKSVTPKKTASSSGDTPDAGGSGSIDGQDSAPSTSDADPPTATWSTDALANGPSVSAEDGDVSSTSLRGTGAGIGTSEATATPERSSVRSSSSSSSPRYLSYRSQLAQSATKANVSNSTPGADDKDGAVRKDDSDDEHRSNHAVAAAVLAGATTGAAVTALAVGDKSGDTPVANQPNDTPVQAAQSSSASPRYQSYRSSLASSVRQSESSSRAAENGVKPTKEDDTDSAMIAPAVVAAAAVGAVAGGAAAGAANSENTAEPTPGPPSTASTPQPSTPRYQSYRSSMAQRLSATKPANDTKDDALSDDDVDENEVEERLSSYLQKGVAGAAVAGTAAAVAATAASAGNTNSTSSTPSSPPLPEPVTSVSPLRSSRAAAALARARAASETRSQSAEKPVISESTKKEDTPVQTLPTDNEAKTSFKKSRTSAAVVSPEPQSRSAPEPSSASEESDIEAGIVSTADEAVEDGPAKNDADVAKGSPCWMWVCIGLAVIALGVGLGVGLGLPRNTGGSPPSPTASPTPLNGVRDSNPFVPTIAPTIAPASPTISPSQAPTSSTLAPSTLAPTTAAPVSASPTTAQPSAAPSTASPTTTAPTTSAPTSAPSSDPARQELLNQLSGVSFDGGAALRTSGTPQNQSFEWLANSADLASLSLARRIQRYALASLYYSTGGENWTNADGWLSGGDECGWYSLSTNMCIAGSVSELNLGFNGLGGTLPAELGLLTGLTRLALSGGRSTRIGGSLPTELGALSLLEFFSVSNNTIQGDIPESFSGWSRVSYLDLSENQFASSFPASITGLGALTTLDMASNEFSGSVPDISSLSNLRKLDISNNRFSSFADGSIGTLGQLQTLSIQNNELTSLPNAVGLLTSLEKFEAFENRASGPMLDLLGGLTNLHTMDLHGNRLSGPLPTELGVLTTLRNLDLSGNQFDGEIPTELGLLTNLQNLHLNSNAFRGQIPSDLRSLTALDLIRVDDNDLTGAVPREVCSVFGRELPTFYLDCAGNNPEVVCQPGACCTFCCSQTSGASSCECLYENTGFAYLCDRT